jgi:hypothetical protein
LIAEEKFLLGLAEIELKIILVLLISMIIFIVYKKLKD